MRAGLRAGAFGADARVGYPLGRASPPTGAVERAAPLGAAQGGSSMASMSGGDLVVRTLKAAGVDTVFGIVSVHNIPIYDAIGRLGGIRPVPVRQEQAAVLAADGYARVTGKLGVAISSTGPGAGNAMGGITEAYWANSPVLHLTGNIESKYLGKAKGYIHEAPNQLGMLEATSKWAGRPSEVGEIPLVLAEAIRQATTGRTRPVSVEIPIDLQYFEEDVPEQPLDLFARAAPDAGDVERAAELVAGATRPLIWAGGGAIWSGASAEVTRLAEMLGAGVVTSIGGRGSIPEDHPLCIGAIPLEAPVQALLGEADVLIAVGTRFQGYNTQNWALKLPPTIVHFDVDAGEIGRNYPVAAGVVGDAKLALGGLLSALEGRAPAPDPAWGEQVARARAEGRGGLRARVGQYADIMDQMRRILPREAIVVKDATIPAYTWGNRLLEVYEPRTSLHSTSVAIGPGLPLAVGAAIGKPGVPVALIAGDGGFMYNVGELATAAQERLPLVTLIFNDGGYGVLRNIQDAQFEGRRMASVDLHTPDFVKLAEAFGLGASKVSSVEEFGPAFERAVRSGGPALIELDLRAIGPMPVPFGGTSRRPTRA
jgi:acetolactate synthase I/II/III large subunit